MRGSRRVTRLGRVVLPALAIGAWLVVSVIVLGAALGGYRPHDYVAYDLAVRHLLAGQPIYDTTVAITGGLGLFLYPPTFLVLILPIGLVPAGVATVAWLGLLIAASIAAILLLPVPPAVRWTVLLLAAVFDPLQNGLAQGQVGPILLLLLAAGWRWLERPIRLGATIALGAAIKLQPAILVAWAIATGRRRAALVALIVFAGLALAGTLLVGPRGWVDQMTSLTRTNNPILAPNNLGAGHLAYEAGLTAEVAWLFQLASLAAVALLVAVMTLRATPTASYLAVAVATQLLSPVIWPHYAIVLLLPLAWLLAGGRWWSLAIPVALSIPGAAVLPPLTHLAAYWIALVAIAVDPRSRRSSEATIPGPRPVLTAA